MWNLDTEIQLVALNSVCMSTSCQDYLFSIKTDKEGLATFTPPEECKDFNCRTFGFWIEQKESGTVMFRENSLSDYYGDFRSGEIQASLTVAHALVEPGDDVRLIGTGIWIISSLIVEIKLDLCSLHCYRSCEFRTLHERAFSNFLEFSFLAKACLICLIHTARFFKVFISKLALTWFMFLFLPLIIYQRTPVFA